MIKHYIGHKGRTQRQKELSMKATGWIVDLVINHNINVKVQSFSWYQLYQITKRRRPSTKKVSLILKILMIMNALNVWSDSYILQKVKQQQLQKLREN